MLAGYSKSYKKLNWIIKVILAVIPVTGWVNAVVYRLATGHLIAALLAIPFGPLFWLVDLITVILAGKPTVFA